MKFKYGIDFSKMNYIFHLTEIAYYLCNNSKKKQGYMPD